MSKGNVPSREAELAAYTKQFYSAIAEDPALYRVTPEELHDVQHLSSLWDESYAAATAARDEARAAVQAKTLTQKELTDVLRTMSRRIQADNHVPDAARAKAGLPIHKTTRTPVPVPKTQPVGRVELTGPLQHELYFTADTHRGKPPGVLACRIHMHVGPTAPIDPAEYTFVAQTGRSPYRVMHDKDDSGKIAHYILQWVNTREEVGPWSTPISGTVPAI